MAKHLQTINISAVAWQEGNLWVAQGIEYDIVAHADDMLALPKAFETAVVENIFISLHLGRQPLAGIKPAPDKYRSMFDTAETMVGRVRHAGTADIPLNEIKIRVAAAA